MTWEERKKVLRNRIFAETGVKTCEMCGKREDETDTVFLKYDCGMWLCDDCTIFYYGDWYTDEH